jgi:hypothetical protein
MLKVTVLDRKDAVHCPFRGVIDRIGDKWSLLVLGVLEQSATSESYGVRVKGQSKVSNSSIVNLLFGLWISVL